MNHSFKEKWIKKWTQIYDKIEDDIDFHYNWHKNGPGVDCTCGGCERYWWLRDNIDRVWSIIEKLKK